MSDQPLEQRVGALEEQVQELVARIKSASSDQRKDWRRSLGMFDDRPLMKEIDEAGDRVRQADRKRVSNDHS